MKTMLVAFAATIVIAVVADFGLDYAGFSAAEQTTGNAVRLGE